MGTEFVSGGEGLELRCHSDLGGREANKWIFKYISIRMDRQDAFHLQVLEAVRFLLEFNTHNLFNMLAKEH